MTIDANAQSKTIEKDLQWIKAKYGESMKHFCREKFPKLLETAGYLPKLLAKYFYCQKNCVSIKETNRCICKTFKQRL